MGDSDTTIEDDDDGADDDEGGDASGGLPATTSLTTRDEGEVTGGDGDADDASSWCLRVWFSALIAASRWPMANT